MILEFNIFIDNENTQNEGIVKLIKAQKSEKARSDKSHDDILSDNDSKK